MHEEDLFDSSQQAINTEVIDEWMLGRPDEAKRYYLDAIKVAENMYFRPELALAHFQLAELQFKHFPEEQTEAIEHLNFAIEEFHEMKMQPSLEKAQELKNSI